LLLNRAYLIVQTSLVWGTVDDPSQSISFSATLHTHPFVKAHIALVVFRVDTRTYWTRAPQSIIDHCIVESLWGFHPHVAPLGLTTATIWCVLLDCHYRGIFTGIPPSYCHWPDCQQIRYNASIDMRKEVGKADSSVPL
jgi:hypothetical protein